ncbi:MAG: DUF2752 domain-containing protein [Bacteroidota bacterium]
MKNIKGFPFELIFWILALILLASSDPQAHHFSLCPLANLGVDWCPGCGLGRSIAALFHGDVKGSLAQHWFGIPALSILIFRIYQLSVRLIKRENKFNLKYKED